MTRVTGRATWLTPASEVWERRFGKGTFPFGVAGRALQGVYKALCEDHGKEEAAAKLGRHLEVYLERQDAKYINLFRFAMTFNEYAPQPREALVDRFGCLTEAGRRATG